ncbi:hypothetical protein F5J12DRAFT_766660 [Pisolithus orientalis]|uniref:uncharacterized protein n=1 Tax=Pisolithus orientalis TaxID=936130 RepID=UPI002224D546|nr:uncharacterized protein F5J12DRAFT_766660 [Pisolithus orientalis]KAI6012761.1 hypothetical protein F5J12DRAFT_766660 [Pisolithus orientalis]
MSWIPIPCRWCCVVVSSILVIAQLELPHLAHTLRWTFSPEHQRRWRHSRLRFPLVQLSGKLREKLSAAGETEYDRFWRMPLDEDYGPHIYSSKADLCNPTGSCTAALFLKSFVDGIEPKDGFESTVQWAHLDIARKMEFTRPIPYQGKGMTGRPVRALEKYAKRLSTDQT